MPSPASAAGSRRFMPGSPRGRRGPHTIQRLHHRLRARASTAAQRSAQAPQAPPRATRTRGGAWSPTTPSEGGALTEGGATVHDVIVGVVGRRWELARGSQQ